MEKYQNMTVSQWLEDSFRSFDSLLYLDDGKLFVGGNILQEQIKGINEAIRIKQDELCSKGYGKNGVFAPQNDPNVNEFLELFKEQVSLYKKREANQQKLYGIRAGRYALAKIDELLETASLRDRVLGCEIFLEKFEKKYCCERHNGFLYAVRRRLDWESRKLEREKFDLWQTINRRQAA